MTALEPESDTAQRAGTQSQEHKGSRSLRRIGWFVIAAVAVSAGVVAATTTRPPATEAERAYDLKEGTLCPVCDGQSVLESNAPAAAAMRRQIDQWVSEGRTDTQIRADLAAAYGEDVNALPPGEGIGTLVWALPVAAFAAAAAGLWAATRRWRSRSSSASPTGSPSADSSEDPEPQAPTARPRRRVTPAVTVAVLVLVGALAGVLAARSAGLRLAGETLSGDIERSARSQLVDAQRQFAANQLDEARATLEEIFRLDPQLRGALVLSARLHLRNCEALAANPSSLDPGVGATEGGCDLTSALADLDRVLADAPADTEALALRGWMLVRIPDAELMAAGIASLDAAVGLNPGEFDPWVFRGFAARFVERDLEAAIGYYREALERGPPAAMAAALEGAIAEMQSAPDS